MSFRAWGDGELVSPENGEPLVYEAPEILSDGENPWPIIEGIPFLRVGRESLRDEAVSHLRRGDTKSALAVLLRDQDDWAPDPPPDLAATTKLAEGHYSLEKAMELLDFGRVGDYLINRPSDPTYLAGLALMQDNLSGVKSAFQLACGIGNYSRELDRRGIATTAADVVFSKVWLARRHVTPRTRLICTDASRPFPVPDAPSFDLVFCQDAFYFLPEKQHVVSEMLRLAGENGTVYIGHAHNADAENLSSGAPLTVREYAALFPEKPLLYDDSRLTMDFILRRTPSPESAEELEKTDAICLLHRHRGAGADITLPPEGTPLTMNPLYEERVEPGCYDLVWPSTRYEEEYAPLAVYLPKTVEVSPETLRLAHEVGVGESEEVDELAMKRVLLDLPESWGR